MLDPLRAVALEPMILALLDQQPDHGYSLMLRIKDQMGIDLSDGSLYPTLKRLEDAGHVEGAWETPAGGRRRKVHRLTSDGRSALRRARTSWPILVKRFTHLLLPGTATGEARA